MKQSATMTLLKRELHYFQTMVNVDYRVYMAGVRKIKAIAEKMREEQRRLNVKKKTTHP